MKLIYMGTPDFAVSALEALADSCEVVAAVTQPDRPKGRGYETVPTPVKTAALSRGIPVFQPDKLKNGEMKPILDKYMPDMIVVCAYGKILPDYILNYPRLGCINIHASLLPAYRGAAPIQRCLMDGVKETGVTVMKMDAGLDTGDMIYKKSVAVPPDMNFGALHDLLAALGAEAICEALPSIENGTASYVHQGEATTAYAAMIEKEDCRLDFSQGAEICVNRIRALSPVPCAYFSFEGKTIKVISATVGSEKLKAGIISDGKILSVGTGDGSLILDAVRPEGKKEMQGTAFMAGRRRMGGITD